MVIEQIEDIARASWEAHPASQPATLEDRIVACALGEDLLQVLIKHPSSIPQILDKVYLERQEFPWREGVDRPRVGVAIVEEAVEGFVEGGGIDYVSFETHPEWTLEKGAADKRWLIVRGLYVDDCLSKRWANEYIFEHYAIRKIEKIREGIEWRTVNENAVLEKSDLDIIGSVFLGIRSQVVPLLAKSG